MSAPIDPPPDIPLWRRSLRTLGFPLGQSEQERLLSDIASLQSAIQRYERQSADATQGSWKEACNDLLQKARVAANARDVHSGYEILHTAERESVLGMSPEDRAVRGHSLVLEAREKMAGSWRGQAMLECLDPKAPSLGPGALMEAIGHRNTADRNKRRKADSLRTQLFLIRWGLVAMIAVALWAARLERCLPNEVQICLLPRAIYLGLLGGFISSALSLRLQDLKVAVPEIQMSWQLTTTRVLIGAAAAIPVFIIANTGVIRIGSATGDNGERLSVLLLCFIAGFSERWFMNTILSLSGEGKDAAPSEAKPTPKV